MKTLAAWLDYQQHTHPRGIDLGLDRVREVWRRMGAPRPAPVVITVGGTNGKGSTVALLEAMLRGGGMRVGAYTSPHLLRYNERFRIAGVETPDADLTAAFERVEAARGAVTLTFFEYATLAALDVFARARLEVALLEVGMGGRLDAVNIIDTDCAVVVTVDLDHMQYLGPDRESIGREKAGILRAGRPAILGETAPPHSLLAHARELGAKVAILGRDFGWLPVAGGSAWWCGTPALHAPVDPALVVRGELALEGTFQYHNAAAAVAALHALGGRVRWNIHALEKAAGNATQLLPGRLQHLGSHPDLVVDVGHNPQAAHELADWLDRHPVPGTTRAVFGAMADKDIEAVVGALGARISCWYLAGLEQESPRGETAARLATRVRAALPDAPQVVLPDVAAALAAARLAAGPSDRILAFGSFHVVAPVMRAYRL